MNYNPHLEKRQNKMNYFRTVIRSVVSMKALHFTAGKLVTLVCLSAGIVGVPGANNSVYLFITNFPIC